MSANIAARRARRHPIPAYPAFAVASARPTAVAKLSRASGVGNEPVGTRRAARAREEVSVSRTALDIVKVAPSGRRQEHRFNPFWTKFRVARHDEIGITAMAVEGEGRRVPIGAFLNPDDREGFATAFGRALATAKAG